MQDQHQSYQENLLKRLAELELLLELSYAISRLPDLHSILELIVNKCLEVFQAQEGAIKLLSTETEVDFNTLISGKDESVEEVGYRVGPSILGWLLKTREPLVVNDLDSDARFKMLARELKGLRSVMAAPLMVRGEVRGALCVSNRRDKTPFTDEDARLLSIIGTAAAEIIENERLREEAIEKDRKSQALSRLIDSAAVETYGEFIARTKKSAELKAKIAEMAEVAGPYLLTGEPGSGKELFARKVHEKKASGPVLAVDCLSITEDNWRQVLFGLQDIVEGTADVPEALGASMHGYLELAEGGSLILRNIESLPVEAQEALAAIAVPIRGAKDVAPSLFLTTCLSKQEITKPDRLSPSLLEIAAEALVEVPPLRKRKRDIPGLIEYIAGRQAERMGIESPEFSDEAMAVLLEYDYHVENIKELEDVVKRAVILSRGQRVELEHVFLVPPSIEEKFTFDVLSIGWLRSVLVSEKIRMAAKAGIGAIFGLLILATFGVGGIVPATYANLAVWAVWWPLLLVSIVAFGRSWCSVCPIALFGSLGRKIKPEKVLAPGFMKRYYGYAVTIGFLAILWVEEVAHMRSHPFATGLLLSFLALGALVTTIFLQRESWCRYLCPLGAFLGSSSSCSIVRLGSKYDVCMSKCEKQECFSGTEDREGCPVFLHTPFVDNSQFCKLCMRCAQLCQNDSPKLMLRPPGQELWTSMRLDTTLGVFVAAVLGAVVALTLLVPGGPLGEFHESTSMFSVFFLGIVLAVCGIIWGAAVASLGRISGSFAAARQASFAFIPILFAGFLSFHVGNIPSVDTVLLSWAGGRALMVMDIFRVLLLAAGLLLGGHTLFRISSDLAKSGAAETRVRVFYSAVMILITVVISF
jgi:transcriptional regulator with GAF, ATPase, and Fis domain/polyferredoxin